MPEEQIKPGENLYQRIEWILEQEKKISQDDSGFGSPDQMIHGGLVNSMPQAFSLNEVIGLFKYMEEKYSTKDEIVQLQNTILDYLEKTCSPDVYSTLKPTIIQLFSKEINKYSKTVVAEDQSTSI
jgi:hypothetical protein